VRLIIVAVILSASMSECKTSFVLCLRVVDVWIDLPNTRGCKSVVASYALTFVFMMISQVATGGG
jgi:hypothetical protein